MSECEEKYALKLNLKGHKKPITGISFNPNGKDFATSSEDHTIMVWNFSQNTRSYNFKGHNDSVTCVEYSPSGEFLASCSEDQTLRIWVTKQSQMGTCLEIRAHLSPIRCLAFAPKGNQIITGSNDKSIKLWSTTRKHFLKSFVGHTSWVRSLQFAPDGQKIVSCADDQTVRVWDPTTGQNVHTFRTSKSGPCNVALHPNGNNIAVAMNSGSVRVYDIRNEKLNQHYVLHDSTTCVCWHPCANFLLTSGKDGKVNLVDVMEGRPLYTFQGHEGAVMAVRFNQGGDYFATGGADRRVMVWKLNLDN